MNLDREWLRENQPVGVLKLIISSDALAATFKCEGEFFRRWAEESARQG